MKRFAEDTKEYSKEKNWWETIPLKREEINKNPIQNIVEKTEKTNKKLKKRRHSCSPLPIKKKKSHKIKEKSENKMEKLRAERIQREEQERKRAEVLLRPKKEEPRMTELEKERTRKYNSQFNPEFAKH